MIISDPNRLKQIIINLVSNSMKYTKKGAIEINVEEYVQIENTI